MLFCLIHNILNTLIACKISEVFQLFFLGFPLIRNHMKIGNSKIVKRTKQIFLKPKRISGKKIFSRIFLILVVSFSIKSIILLYIKRFSFAFFVSALKTLYKGAAFFNIYFSESFFTLTSLQRFHFVFSDSP